MSGMQLSEDVLCALPFAIWHKDGTLRYVWANPEWQRFLGLTEGDCHGRLDRDMLPRRMADLLEIGDLRAISHGTSSEEITLINHDQMERTLRLHRMPHFDARHQLTGLTIIATDTTYQQLLSQQLEMLMREMDAQRQALHQHALVTITRADGRYLYASEPFCRLTGYAQQELLGSSRHQLDFVPNDFDQRLQTLHFVEAIRFEFHGHAKDGSDFWLQSLLVPMANKGTGERSYFEISTDITSIKQREESLESEVHRRTEELSRMNAVLAMDVDVREQVEADLRHQHALVQSMLASLTEEILLLSGKGLLLQTNLPWDNFAGQAAVDQTLHAAVAGDNFIDYLRSLSHPLYHALADRLQDILAGAINSHEMRYSEASRQGERHFALTASAWIGEERGIIITERDVTDAQQNAIALEKRNTELLALNEQLRDVQHQLLQSEKMASIGQLAAGIAHEINNPIGYVNSNLGALERYLTDLIGLVDEYERGLTALDHAPLHDRIAKARRAIDYEFMRTDIDALLSESKEGISRVKRIVQDLKDFSRVDSTQEWGMADLHAAIDSTLNIVNNELKYKASIIKEYDPLPEVECVISQLNQVFLNMLVNAGHAIEHHGCITIRTRHDDGQVCISFIDTGKGIPAELLNRIFDPFFTTKPVGQGTGLGLSLSYGIVQKHHGRIAVNSTPGKGTTFDIWLPILQPIRSGERIDLMPEFPT
ncbi:PAS domain S-box-containing protein [Andreprevotia lacus DSM 23236]|uniref:histidine kinase n=2 Tax=Andreprevotia TaxID=397275 RepID=A0A1W1XGX0_9NEIS|nr:PAS domain S-box-containing protein [Andreprevotia lacus DSM 23236]